MFPERVRLACLGTSHGARVMADNALRLFVVLALADLAEVHRSSAWHLVTFIFMLPAVLLAPVNGALCNSLPKPAVLAVSAAVALLAFPLLALDLHLSRETCLLVAWGIVALSSAVNGPVRYAFLPAAAVDAHIPLTRVNGLFELTSAVAIVLGFLFAAHFRGPEHEATFLENLLVLQAVALVAALAVRFPSDVRRPEPAFRAIRGFFADCRRIWQRKEARGCLFGLSLLRGLVTGMMGALVAGTLANNAFQIEELLRIGAWVLAGVAAGSLLAGVERHPRRVLGFVPFGATGLTLGLMLAALGQTPGAVLCVLLGIMVGLINVPLAATYQADLPADARGNGMAVRNFSDYVCVALFAGLLFLLSKAGVGWSAQLWILAGVAGGAALWSWSLVAREVAELIMEILIWPIYRIRSHGPGIDAMPREGPVLVISNHTAWFDPVWIAKLLPRRLIPMLTSVFFDLPVLRWVMSRLANAIRVEASTFRREIPEIQKAIEVLDRGDALIIFPEGALRKKEEQLLKQFGQGVWHILKERPDTPVVTCWIEGAWGSFFSYFNGRPTKNKRMDFWRRIDVAVDRPFLVPPDVLADQRATRRFLMHKILETRGLLGLDTPAGDKNRLLDDEEQAAAAESPP